MQINNEKELNYASFYSLKTTNKTQFNECHLLMKEVWRFKFKFAYLQIASYPSIKENYAHREIKQEF